jgi:hypothetical protein
MSNERNDYPKSNFSYGRGIQQEQVEDVVRQSPLERTRGVGEMEEQVELQDQPVINALSNPKWQFRTVAGIAKETGLPEDEVVRVLAKYPRLVRHSLVPDRSGQALYTFRGRPVGLKERLSVLQVLLTKSAY